jgi:hypothetical protein
MMERYPEGNYRLVPDVPTPATADRRITKLAFRSRFTKAEKAVWGGGVRKAVLAA